MASSASPTNSARDTAASGAVVQRITGLCMLITGPCFRKVGCLDERFGIGNFEDDDYCVRARLAGFVCVIAGDVFVHHFGSQTFKALGVDYAALLEENKGKFLDKWKELVAVKAARPSGARS